MTSWTTAGPRLSLCPHLQDGPGNCERYLCWASAFLVVYSIDDRRSFEGCERYLEVLALHSRGCQRRCPVLLLGNKLDMEQYRYRARGKAACSPWDRAHRSPALQLGCKTQI